MSNNELKKSIPIKTYNQTKKTLKGMIAQKEADLYEANNRINDLLDMMKIKEKIIDYMIEEYEYNARINLKNFCDDETRKDRCIQDCKICVKKYFEERCK